MVVVIGGKGLGFWDFAKYLCFLSEQVVGKGKGFSVVVLEAGRPLGRPWCSQMWERRQQLLEIKQLCRFFQGTECRVEADFIH